MYLIDTNISNEEKQLSVRVVTIRSIKQIRNTLDVFLKTLSADKAQLSALINIKAV